MNRWTSWAAVLAICAASVAPALAANITSVVETGGDNEATDTILAKWSGQTWNRTIANEPTTGAVDTPFTLGPFDNRIPAFVDRNHVFSNHSVDPNATPANFQIPSYLIGGEYIMSGNDNRDNASYKLDVTVSSPSTVYMLIDNRLGDTSGANPPTFDATHMQWILDQGWISTSNGLNRTGDTLVPDEVPIDEGADNTINQWYSVYRKDVPAGTFSLLQADNAGQNMYGAVVVPIPEPSTIALLGCAAAGLALVIRRRLGR
jgi:PEP-CTERM motif